MPNEFVVTNSPIPGALRYTFSVCDSTNLRAKDLALQGAPDLSCAIADRQTAGRGRLTRAWESPENKGLYVTFIVRLTDAQFAQAPLLSFAAALAMREALLPFGVPAGCKWPNDIVCHGKKLCGILSEATFLSGACFAVVGMGLNLTHTEDDFAKLQLPQATSLLLCGAKVTKDDVLANLCPAMAKWCDVARRDDGALLEAFSNVCITLGQKVTVHQGETVFNDVALSVCEDGALLLKNAGRVVAGDVSIRGRDSYV